MDSSPFYNNRFHRTSDTKGQTINSQTTVPEWPLRDARTASAEDPQHSKLQLSDLKINDQKVVSNDGKDNVLQTTSDKNNSVLGDRKINIAAEANKRNSLNHQLHDVAWFPLCFPFVFLCCMPAMLYMRRSDEEFADGHIKKADRYRILSTALYATGTFVSLATMALCVFVIVYFLQ